MEQYGTMRDGIIVPDEPAAFQEGERIVIQPVESDLPDEPYIFLETREESIACLRESGAEMKEGKVSP